VLTSNATILLITPTDYCVGVSSQCHDPAEVSVSGTFWNLSLIYKICISLYVLIGLQRKLRDLHYEHSSHSFNKLIKFKLIVS